MAAFRRIDLPAAEVLRSWEGVAEALEWAKLAKSAWTPVAVQLGDADLNDLVLIANISPAEWETAMDRAQATPVVKAKLRLIRAAAVLRCGDHGRVTSAAPSIWAQWNPEEWRAYWAQWSDQEWQDWHAGPASVRRAWRHQVLASITAPSSSSASTALDSAEAGGRSLKRSKDDR